MPLHRQFAGHDKPITWRSHLGHGLDGIVFKASIGDDVYAIKVFWHARPPSYSYWSFPRECHVVAMLDKIKWVLEHADGPIMVNANPKTVADAVKNLRAFSDEGRAKPEIFEDATPVPPFPPITRCFGWMQLDSEKLPRRFHRYLEHEFPRGFQGVGAHYAMVYEYVPDTGETDPSVIQAQFDFFYLAGFSLHDIKPDNWRQGKLVDFCDLATLVDPFAKSRWKRRDARQYLPLIVPPKVENDGPAKKAKGGVA
ncbi:hypothetical protein VTK56DRAFT_9589 [Thermocarpiscus australiensis]